MQAEMKIAVAGTTGGSAEKHAGLATAWSKPALEEYYCLCGWGEDGNQALRR